MTFVTDTPAPTNVVFDYTSRDYASIYADLVNRIPLYLPEWTSQSPSDFGQVLLQMFAYVGDLLSYYLDRLGGEAFITTATQPVSITNIAAMLDYVPTLSVGATVTLQITISQVLGTYPVVIPAGTEFATVASPTQPAIVFQTTEALSIFGPDQATPSYVGTVPAVQGVTQSNETVATSTGAVDQLYPLLFNPVSSGSVQAFVDLGLGPQPWTYVQNLINSGPTSQVFTSFVDSDGTFYIVFGDGVNGYVPPLGSPITATYQINVGALGNVGANTITQPVSAIIGVTLVTNPLAATGGTAAESLVSIQQNAPASLKALNRAVTLQDFSTLVTQVAGVQWASAVAVTYQLVNLFICPFGGGDPTSTLISEVLAYLTGPPSLIMANTTVTIMDPTFVEINVTASVVVYPNFGNTSTQQAIAAALANLLVLDNTGFGLRISLGLVISTIMAVPGVWYVTVTALNRLPLATLTTALTNGESGITSLGVSPLPQPVSSGDTIVLANLVGGTQTVTASGAAAAGAISIPVGSFTANANYPVGSSVQDTTGTNDAVLLPNEIPTAGTFTISVTGGVAGS